MSDEGLNGYAESSSTSEEEAAAVSKKARHHQCSDHEEEDDDPMDVAAPVAAASQPLRDDEDVALNDEEDATDHYRAYKILKTRWLGNKRRSVTDILLEELDMDITVTSDQYDLATLRKKWGEIVLSTCEVEMALIRERFYVKEDGEDDDLNDDTHVWNRLRKNLATADEISDDFDTIRLAMDRVSRISEFALNLNQIAYGANSATIGVTPEDLIRRYTMHTGKLHIIIEATTFFLEQAHRRGLRKSKPTKGGSEVLLYEPRTILGKRTVSFQQAGTLKDWIHQISSPDVAPDIFSTLFAKPTTITSVLRYLEDTFDSRLPEYKVSEYIHGFPNCFVNARTCEVFFYDKNPNNTHQYVARHHHEGCFLRPEWFNTPRPRIDEARHMWVFEHDLYKVTPPNGRPTHIELCIEYDEVHDEPPPLHIPMTAAYQILDYQNFSSQKMLWFFAMVGRLLLPVGTLDSFGTILLLSGATQSGKSKFLEAIQAALLPNRDLVAILGSNKEEVFGLGKAAMCDVLLCDEMEKRPRWNMGEIKSMATGGWMSINVKHGDPIFKRWTAPVIMSSNFKVPEWGGGANDVYAIIRRFAPFWFPNTVAIPDEELGRILLNDEGPQLFVTCLLCYHYILNNVGTSAFNRNAPPECRQSLRDMLIELHPFVAYLETSRDIETPPKDCDPEERRLYYVTLEELGDRFTEWVKKRHIKNDNQWKPEFYGAPLTDMGCRITEDRELREYPLNSGGLTKKTIFVDGMRFAL